MASILRSSKFVRYIAGFARNVVLNTPREFDGNLVNNTQCLCGALTRSFAAQVPQHLDQNLEYSLRRIDQDVRKSGRISRRDIEDVLEEIRTSRSATSSQSLLVIRCCGNLVPEEMPEIRTKLVQEIWSTLNKLNVPMDVSHYNALLRVYLENEHEFSPTDFLAELEAKGIEPNRVTFQRLIARYCQLGDIEGATKILEFMREKQLPVNENVFNALIMGHSQAGDMDSAHGILNVMSQAGLEASADTYTTLLCGYAKNGNIESIEKIIKECETKDIFLLDKDYLDIIYNLTINNHTEHVPLIINKLRKQIGYNQDAINLILRLINKNHENIAFLILQTMVRSKRDDGTTLPLGNFFIRQMVKKNCSIDSIIDISKKLEANDMYDRALLLATETSLQLGNDQLAIALLHEMKANNYEIRQHYFWPLIIAKSIEEPTNNGIINILKEMQNFGLQPNLETLRDYVIPRLKGTSSEILQDLRETTSLGNAISCLVLSLLQKNNMEEAALISSKGNAYFNPELFKRLLTNAYYKTKDLNSYIVILRNIYENLDKRPSQDGELDKTEIIGQFIIDLAHQRDFDIIIQSVLERLVEQGLSISNGTAEKIQEKLGGEKMTESLSSLLGKLTSGDLIPIPIEKKLMYTPSSQMTIPQLERLIHNLEQKKQDVNGLKRHLFTLYYREKDLEKTELLLKGLDDGFVFTAGLYAQLTDLYAYHDNLDKTLYYYEKMKNDTNLTDDSGVLMDDSKIIRVVHLLIKNNQFDKGISFLEKGERKVERTFNYQAQIWRLLNYLAEEKRVEDLNNLFDVLVKNDYIDINNVILGPLIKVHLLNNDLDKAMEKFEFCVKQYKATPWKNELTCKLIQLEDAEKLQKLTDLSTEVHGEINSLYDLVFAFVECGRIRQARKILETPGLQSRPQRINTICEHYRQEGLIKPLEGLKDATKDLNHIDRADIYYQLLLTYIKKKDSEKALGLWTQMQEEDLLPTDEFLMVLADFLNSEQKQVPFVVPKKEFQMAPTPPPPPPSLAINDKLSSLQIFRQKLRTNDLNAAIAMNNFTFPLTELSILIEKLIQHERISDATNLTIQMLDKKLIPINRVFRFLLNKLASSGNVELLENINAKIDQNVKKLVSFDNRLCHAYLMAGKSDEFLMKLEWAIDHASNEDLPVIGEKFPRGGVCGILEKHPELLDKYENIAGKYVAKGIAAPMNVLWTHYFINNEESKAEDIWNKYLKDAPRIMFQRIVHAARDNKNEQLIRRLIDHLKISKVTEGAIGNAYSCLLDVLVMNDKHEDAISAFESAIKDVGLEYINRTAILRVRESFQRLNKTFDYNIPAKNVKNTATSSSEDDVKASN